MIQYYLSLLATTVALLIISSQSLADIDQHRPEGVSEQKWSSLRAVVQEAKLLPTPEGLSGVMSEFGHAISLDGQRVAISGQKSAGSGAVFIFEYKGSKWVEQATLIPSDGEQNDRFGHSVSLDGDRVLVGAHWNDDLGSTSGSAYIFDFNGTAWLQTTKLLPTDGAAGDQFGSSVSLSGDNAFVGAPRNDGGSTFGGAVYVFHLSDNQWIQDDKIMPADAGANDQFGSAISVSGTRALIGAEDDSEGSPLIGSAYIYDYDGNSWNESAKLLASDGSSHDDFGSSVSLSGNRALIGAKLDDVNTSNAGSVYVFDFDGLTWSETAKIIPSDSTTGIRFGQSVSLQGDVFVVGAHQNRSNGLDYGAAYVFEYDGVNWQQIDKLTAADKSQHDELGYSVAIDGQFIFAGAHHDMDFGAQSGSAYVFELDGASWIETQEIHPEEGAANDYFGYSVSIDGDKALVGAFRDGIYEADSGAAYIYQFDGTNWQQTTKLTTSNGDSLRFGKSVSLNGNRAMVGASGNSDVGVIRGAAYVFDFDGQNWNQSAKLSTFDAFHSGFADTVSLFDDRAVIGCYGDDDEGFDAGAIFVYELNGGSWQETAKLTASDGSANDRFGISVSLFDDRILVGASNESVFGLDSGAAYVFDYDGVQWNESEKLSPSDGGGGDEFGNIVSLFDDRALIGAHLDDDSGTNSGSAYVFEFINNGWQQTAKLLASDGAADDQFAHSLDLKEDRIIIGSLFNDENGHDSGAAYLYEYDGIQWFENNKLMAANGSVSDQFGNAVSLSGAHTLIGALLDDDRGLDAGAAYIFDINRLKIGGTVSGLAKNNEVILQNNLNDDLPVSANGIFEFNTPLDNSSPYAVSVLNQPTNPNQTCMVTGGSNGDGTGIINMTDVSDIMVTCSINQYNINLNVSGLVGDGISFSNGVDQITVNSNSLQTISTLDDGSVYDIDITDQPESPNQVCGFTDPDAGGLAGNDVTVNVECVTVQYTVSVDVSGLAAGNSLVLQNNGGDDLTVISDGQSTFATVLDDGSSFNVTVLTQPINPNQVCQVNQGSGQVSGGNVDTIQVVCVTDVHTVGGTISGLANNNLVTLTINSGVENLIVPSNGNFDFVNALEDTSVYAVTVLSQPTTPNQTCGVVNGSGVLMGADVSNIEVNCITNQYFIGGYITDLIPDNNLILQNNGTDDLSIFEDGAFVFAIPLDDEQAYEVSILNHPNDPIQPCVLINGSGNLHGNDVDDVMVKCEFGNDLIYRHGFDTPKAIFVK